MAMQSVTNATLTGITAVGNTAAYGGAMLIDRAALIQVPSLSSIGQCIMYTPL